MSKNIQFEAQARDGAGKGAARTLRRDNRIPAVIYGDNKAPVLISLEQKPITTELHKGHLFTSLCDVKVGSEKHHVITRDVQLDPVSDKIVHDDFLRVSGKTMVKVNIPVHFVGQDVNPVLKSGQGTLTVTHHEVELMCQASSIPEQIEIDITALEFGQAIKLSDIKLPKGTKPATSDAEHYTIASLHEARVMQVEEETPAATAAAPAEAAAPAKADK